MPKLPPLASALLPWIERTSKDDDDFARYIVESWAEETCIEVEEWVDRARVWAKERSGRVNLVGVDMRPQRPEYPCKNPDCSPCLARKEVKG